jgi:zinc transport system permease protein
MDGFYEWCKRLAEAGALPRSFQYAFMVRGVLAALLVSPLLGGMSHLVVTKRLAFFSAALGNAALTGLVIGIALGESIDHPYGGLFGFCLLVAIGMVYVKRRSRLSPDTLVGVFLSLTLGLGICLLVAATKRFNIHQIQSVMFGDILTVTDRDLALLLVIGVIVGALLARFYNDILFAALDPSLARSAGVRVALLEYVFVILLTLSIVASLKIIGALLVEALVVVPAAAAKNLARGAAGYLGWSVGLATLGSVSGLLLSDAFPVPSGGAIVLTLTALFFVTLGAGLLFRRNR